MQLYKTEIRQTLISRTLISRTLIHSWTWRSRVVVRRRFLFRCFGGSLGVRNSWSNYGMSPHDLRF